MTERLRAVPNTPRVTLDDLQVWYRYLYFGNPGVGKTTAIAQAAQMGRIVYIDPDNGLKAKALRRHGIPTNNIEPYPQLSYQKMLDLHEDLRVRLADGEKIFAVAWDTTTKSAEGFLDEVMPRSLAKTARKAQRQSVEDERSEFEVYLEDRGEVVEMMKKLLRLYHGLPCHLLLGAHSRRDKDEDGAVQIGPAMSPSVVASYSGWMDGVIYMQTETFDGDPSLAEWEGTEVVGLTRPTGRFIAKDRFGLLPKRMVNPSFDRVVKYLEGDITKDKDPLQLAAARRRSGAAVAVDVEANGAEEPAEEPSEVSAE